MDFSLPVPSTGLGCEDKANRKLLKVMVWWSTCLLLSKPGSSFSLVERHFDITKSIRIDFPLHSNGFSPTFNGVSWFIYASCWDYPINKALMFNKGRRWVGAKANLIKFGSRSQSNLIGFSLAIIFRDASVGMSRKFFRFEMTASRLKRIRRNWFS